MIWIVSAPSASRTDRVTFCLNCSASVSSFSFILDIICNQLFACSPAARFNDKKYKALASFLLPFYFKLLLSGADRILMKMEYFNVKRWIINTKLPASDAVFVFFSFFFLMEDSSRVHFALDGSRNELSLVRLVLFETRTHGGFRILFFFPRLALSTHTTLSS